MVRFSSEDLRSRISAILDQDKDLSTRAVTRELRRQGVSVGNVRARALTEISRVDREVSRLVNIGRGGDKTRNLTEVISLSGRGRENRLTLARELGFAIDSNEPTHAALNWTATYEAVVMLYGQVSERVSGSAQGRLVQPIEHYNRELLETRIEQQVYGQIVQRVGNGTDSYIEGIEVNIVHLDVDVQPEALRGPAIRGGSRRAA